MNLAVALLVVLAFTVGLLLRIPIGKQMRNAEVMCTIARVAKQRTKGNKTK